MTKPTKFCIFASLKICQKIFRVHMPDDQTHAQSIYQLLLRGAVGAAAFFSIFSLDFSRMLTALATLAVILLIGESFFWFIASLGAAKKKAAEAKEKKEKFAQAQRETAQKFALAQRESASKYIEVRRYNDAAKDKRPM